MNVKSHLTVAQPACFSSAVAGKPPAAFFEYTFRSTAAVLPEGRRSPGRFAAIPFLASPFSGPPDTFAGPPAAAAVGRVPVSGWAGQPMVKPPSRSIGRVASSPPADNGEGVSPIPAYPVRSDSQPGFLDSSHPCFDNWHNPAGQRYEGSLPTPFPGQFHDLPPGVRVQAGPYGNNRLQFMVKNSIFCLRDSGILAVFGQFPFSVFF